MSELLDRPVWHSLVTHHSALSVGDDLARRFLPDVNKFVSGVDDSEAAMTRAAELIEAGEEVYILQVSDIRIPPALSAKMEALGVQMVRTDRTPLPVDAGDMVALGDADAAEMLALATLTQPGPFLARTHEMGPFWGVRIDGRLAAMAGERMRFPGFTEVSGVCSHPDFRGLGLAKRLSAQITNSILARGDTPFLHAWATNATAIGLYESLGFSIRCEVQAAVLERTG